jgi:hypothetical protein
MELSDDSLAHYITANMGIDGDIVKKALEILQHG